MLTKRVARCRCFKDHADKEVMALDLFLAVCLEARCQCYSVSENRLLRPARILRAICSVGKNLTSRLKRVFDKV